MPEPTSWAIEVDGLAVGSVGVKLGEGVYLKSAEFGYWLAEPYWGRGIMTDAVKAASAYAMRRFGLIRLEAPVFEWNPASMRVLEKAGFVREGVLRASAVKDGQVIDRVLYALIDAHELPPDGSVATLKAITAAFNAHDLDAIMEFFADDCSLDMPRGPDPWGKRFTGKAAVREGLAARLKGLPDVHYGDDRHWVSANMGVSEWLLTGTMADGTRLRVRGCDHWEFRDGKVIRKDSYWKIVER
jgi:ketosteroid isomerase-like protein